MSPCRLAPLAGAILALQLTACGKPAPAVLAVQRPRLELRALGERQPIVTDVLDAHGAKLLDIPRRFESLDPRIAAVDAHGVVTAAGGGVTEIVVRAGDGAGALTKTVTVSVEPISGVRASPAVLMLAPGAKSQLIAEAVDAQGNALPGVTLSYSVEDPALATVTSTGMVSAIFPGETSIFVTAGPYRAEVTLRVRGDPGLPPPDDSPLPLDYR